MLLRFDVISLEYKCNFHQSKRKSAVDLKKKIKGNKNGWDTCVYAMPTWPFSLCINLCESKWIISPLFLLILLVQCEMLIAVITDKNYYC